MPPPEAEAKGSDYFAEHVKQELLGAEWLGETDQERYQAVFKGGLRVYTTLDPHAQQIAQEAVERMVPEDPRGFTAALASVEPATGAVRALVGGKNFDQTKFNLVTDGDGRLMGVLVLDALKGNIPDGGELGAAIPRGERRAVEAELTHRADEVARERLLLRVPLDDGQHLSVHELARLLARHPLLVGEELLEPHEVGRVARGDGRRGRGRHGATSGQGRGGAAGASVL